MTEIGAEPGSLWPDEVIAGAAGRLIGGVFYPSEYESSVAAARWAEKAARAALSAPEVTAHLLAQHRDGYDSAVEAGESENARLTREVDATRSKWANTNRKLDVARAERNLLAAALADAERRIANVSRFLDRHFYREWDVALRATLRAALAGDAEPRTENGVTWADCTDCGVSIFRHYTWSHQGGMPPQGHEAQPAEDAGEVVESGGNETHRTTLEEPR